MIDKDLFLHDLAIVAIMKCEAPYLKEWLDYHLLAGVDHFYIYDNESPDNQTEVVAPYVKAGLVDYIFAPSEGMQMPVYNDAVKRFKFQARYMAFIDGDEFIYPKSNLAIVDVVDEILSRDPKAAGLAMNWQCFGSNGQEKADYSRGVLERFTRRAPKDWVVMSEKGPNGNALVKTIANPRKISRASVHIMAYFEENHAVNEVGDVVAKGRTESIMAEKIVVNHYHCKSWEEYSKRNERGDVNFFTGKYTKELFDRYDRNDEFDDGILRYRAERARNFKLPDKSRATERLLKALTKNLLPMFLPNTPPKFFARKMETFLTCRAVAEYLKTQLVNDAPAKFFEEVSLVAILNSINVMKFADARLLIRELPNLLALPYPVVKDLRAVALEIIPQMMEAFHMKRKWREYAEFDYLQDILKLGG